MGSSSYDELKTARSEVAGSPSPVSTSRQAPADRPPAYWGDMWPSLYLLFREIRRNSTVAIEIGSFEPKRTATPSTIPGGPWGT